MIRERETTRRKGGSFVVRECHEAHVSGWDPFPFAALRSPLCTAILSSRLVFVSVGFCWLLVGYVSRCGAHV